MISDNSCCCWEQQKSCSLNIPGNTSAQIILSTLFNDRQISLVPCTIVPESLPLYTQCHLEKTTSRVSALLWLWLFYSEKLIKLTVGEGEAWSDIIFHDSCMKATNKQDSVGCETEPSHTRCPHAASQFAVFALQGFGEFMKSVFF